MKRLDKVFVGILLSLVFTPLFIAAIVGAASNVPIGVEGYLFLLYTGMLFAIGSISTSIVIRSASDLLISFSTAIIAAMNYISFTVVVFFGGEIIALFFWIGVMFALINIISYVVKESKVTVPEGFIHLLDRFLYEEGEVYTRHPFLVYDRQEEIRKYGRLNMNFRVYVKPETTIREGEYEIRFIGSSIELTGRIEYSMSLVGCHDFNGLNPIEWSLLDFVKDIRAEVLNESKYSPMNFGSFPKQWKVIEKVEQGIKFSWNGEIEWFPK